MRSDYMQPQGAPRAWNLQEDAKLSEAIKQLFASRGAASPEQLALLRDYLTYYINAPGLRDAIGGQTLLALRRQAPEIASVESLQEWLRVALTIGIDPL